MSRLWDINACLFLLQFSKDRCHHIAIDGKERCFTWQRFLCLDRDYPPPLPIPLIFSSFSCSWRRKTLLQNYPVAKKCTVHERKIERDSRLINPQQLFHTCFIFSSSFQIMVKKLIWPNQIALSIRIMTDLSHFSPDQWEMEINICFERNLSIFLIGWEASRPMRDSKKHRRELSKSKTTVGMVWLN